MLPMTGKDIRLSKATDAEMPVLANLMQLYRYDISESRGDAGQDVLLDGRYPLPQYFASCWADPRCHPFLIHLEGSLAGFVLVRTYSQLTDATDVRDIFVFFIIRKYRRQGIGAAVAMRVFDCFPGKWEVREYRLNHAAQAFWRRVIAKYTDGRFIERMWDDDRHRGIVQRFFFTDRPVNDEMTAEDLFLCPLWYQFDTDDRVPLMAIAETPVQRQISRLPN